MAAKTVEICPRAQRSLRLPRLDALSTLTAAAIVLGVAIRVGVGGDQPLWLDETFTGAIAASPSLTDVLHQSFQDVNAPLYYIVAHAWALPFGLSNEALRSLALLFGCIAPLLCLIPTPGISRRTGMVWAATMALWPPGLALAQEARCYSLLLCLSIGSIICFVRLLDKPDVRRAAAWALIGCLAVLTHYHALVLIGCQGIAYLVVCRARAVRSWPAVILFVPAIVWLLLHSRRIAEFAGPGVAWYRPMRVVDLWAALTYAIGSAVVPLLVVGLMIAGAIGGLIGGKRGVAETVDVVDSDQRNAWIGALCACAGAGLVVALAFLRPTFAPRYLIPFVPGILLGIALCCERFRGSWALAPNVLVLIMATAGINATLRRSPDDKVYNFQAASDALIKAGTRNLVFFWDHPATIIEDSSQLAIVGGFFFKRHGIDVHVSPLQIARHVDPNRRLIALADKPRSAILWIYDASVHDTAAREYPPKIESLAEGWSCRDFGNFPIGILACIPRMSAS